MPPRGHRSGEFEQPGGQDATDLVQPDGVNPAEAPYETVGGDGLDVLDLGVAGLGQAAPAWVYGHVRGEATRGAGEGHDDDEFGAGDVEPVGGDHEGGAPEDAMSGPGPEPVHVPYDGGESVFLVGDTYTTLLSGGQTGGAFTLLEALVMPEAVRPRTYTREGGDLRPARGRAMIVHIGSETYDAQAGTVLYVPRDVPHSYSNIGEGPARMLFMYSPAGMEGMFAEIGRPGRRGALPPPLDPADLEALASVTAKYRLSFLNG